MLRVMPCRTCRRIEMLSALGGAGGSKASFDDEWEMSPADHSSDGQ